MKKFIALLLLPLSITVKAQTLQPGDDLHKAFATIPKPYYFNAPPFTDWLEGKDMIMICDKPHPTDSKYLFLALKDSTLIGIYSSTAPVSFLLDSVGNGTIATPKQYFLLPEWVIKNKTRIDASDKKMAVLLDKFYQKVLQANELQLDQKTMNEYQNYKTDVTLANRHIALLFDNYQTIINYAASEGKTAPADICLPIIQQLSNECQQLYKNVPAIVCVYMGEALMNAGLQNEARTYFKSSLQQYPNSIPLMVYNYRLEEDQAKQKEMLAALKKKYAHHWMVADL